MNLSAMCLTDCQQSGKGLGWQQVQRRWHFVQYITQNQHIWLTADGLRLYPASRHVFTFKSTAQSSQQGDLSFQHLPEAQYSPSASTVASHSNAMQGSCFAAIVSVHLIHVGHRGAQPYKLLTVSLA